MVWKNYPYDKNTLLNTVYDVLEKLDYPMKYVDSHAGLLLITCDEYLIEMQFSTSNHHETCIRILNGEKDMGEMLLDEISSLLKREYRRGE